ncbi:LolA-like outer membrane lipoprotein chaperone [Campylobacter lanienae]|uniref:LolA-like outer membrane lipoprotein chaperone n=1 Tax=Campylobacter lanienae TaxID=75658 RepID=UPI002A9204F6|nr:LolA-like outer membrane lipoprotein chaperone [Campylobacter lanienae]MDY6135109.1 LolA-like outer membrane lipoprotein chaperone [Campylobacter lanienae]
MRKFIIIFTLFLNLFGYSELEFKSLSTKFTQTITSQNQKIIYTGSISIDSDFGAFWQYNTPTQKSIYISNNKITIIEPQLQQAIITNLQNSPDITQILNNAQKLSDNKFQTTYDDITYDIVVENSNPKLISYTDKLGNIATIEFYQTIKNKPINKELLTPKIPSDYDIISN